MGFNSGLKGLTVKIITLLRKKKENILFSPTFHKIYNTK
jgi:hypothetical protein